MIVYLTGGIGTGKSTVLRQFADLGADTMSADDVVRALYADPAVQNAVAEAVGEAMPLDTARIAGKVFADPDALRRLEQVFHPRVQQIVAATAEAKKDGEPLIYEVPLPPAPREGDLVVVVTAPLEIRLERLAKRGMAMDDARARMAAQPDADRYGKDAAYTIVNDGDESALRAAVTEIWQELHDGPRAI